MRREAALLVVAGLLWACGESPRQGTDAATGPLYMDPASLDFSGNPELLDRILADPHTYFRFINIPFSREVCRRHADEVWEGSVGRGTTLNLHGDAHLEQYAVTDLGRGLTDFDDSSRGPGIVDALRFAVSLRLTARANNWEARSDDLVDSFLDGYRAALADTAAEVSKPRVVERIRAGFSADRKRYYESVDSIMEPIPSDEAAELALAMSPYTDLMLKEHPDLERRFFDAVAMGSLKLGVGSALDAKYLVRLAGPEHDPLDDVVLEVKKVRSLAGIECVEAAEGDPLRILVGQTRIAYRPFEFLGYVEFRGDYYWTHAWVANYREMDVETSFESADELAEVAFDVGVQLGKGHYRNVAEPYGHLLRADRLRATEQQRERFLEESRTLAEEVVTAWKSFGVAVRPR
jgi:hypothetical protein